MKATPIFAVLAPLTILSGGQAVNAEAVPADTVYRNAYGYQAAEKPNPGRRIRNVVRFSGGLTGGGDAGHGRGERFAGLSGWASMTRRGFRRCLRSIATGY